MTAEELGQMIWNVKELLRNVYDNKDVEDVILPFTLLRRLDCVLVGSEALVATNMKQLEELGQTSQEDIDNMMPMLMDAAGYKFYNTSGLSLSKLITVPADLTNNFKTYLKGFSPNIREILKNFTGKGENASLSDIFSNLARKNLLLQVTKAFVLNIDLSPDKVDNHIDCQQKESRISSFISPERLIQVVRLKRRDQRNHPEKENCHISDTERLFPVLGFQTGEQLFRVLSSPFLKINQSLTLSLSP